MDGSFRRRVPPEDEGSGAAARPVSPRANEAVPTTPRLLLVEDDLELRALLGKTLGQAGFEVDVTTSGHEARLLISRNDYSVVLSDIGIPDIDGLALLQSLREIENDIPVILMTGDPNVDSAVRAIEHGAFGYLPKPFRLAQLIELVRRAVVTVNLTRVRREAFELVEQQNARRRSSERESLDRAIDSIWMAIQPIVATSGAPFRAHEFLLRSQDPQLSRPEELLREAAAQGRLFDLGRAVRRRVHERSIEAPDDSLLFVNIHPIDLEDEDLYDPDAPLSRIARRVVLEVTERSSIDSIRDVTERVRDLRELGFLIAIDDLGAGFSGLNTFVKIDPDFVKIDRDLIAGIDQSARKRSVVSALIRSFANDLGIEVICEGVETVGERDTLIESGCRLMQGYLFGRPQPHFAHPGFEAGAVD